MCWLVVGVGDQQVRGGCADPVHRHPALRCAGAMGCVCPPLCYEYNHLSSTHRVLCF